MSDRVSERRRAAALARHYREQEDLTIAEIARRLGRAEATVKAYLYDPTGEKARAVKARYVGVCRGCGASYRLVERGDHDRQPNQHLERQRTPCRLWAAISCLLQQRDAAQRASVAYVHAAGATAARGQHLQPLPDQRVERMRDHQRTQRAAGRPRSMNRPSTRPAPGRSARSERTAADESSPTPPPPASDTPPVALLEQHHADVGLQRDRRPALRQHHPPGLFELLTPTLDQRPQQLLVRQQHIQRRQILGQYLWPRERAR